MMVRLAVQFYHGKPYGLGIWNTPFLRNLYPKEELKELVRYKKKVDPGGILNPGKFFHLLPLSLLYLLLSTLFHLLSSFQCHLAFTFQIAIVLKKLIPTEPVPRQ